MKNYLKSIGILFIILGIVLSLFDFLIENKEVIFIVGIICVIVSSIMMLETQQSFVSSNYNQGLFSIHGTFVCLGLILYSLGSKAIPAAELTLLSLTEIIGGIFWVWLPLFGINEIPSNNTIIGGFLIFMSIIYYSLTIKTNRRFIALN